MTEQRDFAYDREICNSAHIGSQADFVIFTTAAMSGWPASLDEIERLKAERESLRAMLSRVVRLLDVHTSSHDEIHEAYWLLSDYLEFGDLPDEKQPLKAEIERMEEQIHALEAENHLLREELGR